jgi:dolichyl-phosphate-mannose--protein O-mannosyl transferase
MALGPSNGHAGEDDVMDLRGNGHWRLAVRGLRFAGLGLFVAVAGLVTRVWSTSTGLTMLAIGVGIYLVAVVVLFTGFVPAILALAKPRPSFWRLRRLLMRDALHARL